jgi:hypothetical protein
VQSDQAALLDNEASLSSLPDGKGNILTRALAGNISSEATTQSGNIFPEAMRWGRPRAASTSSVIPRDWLELRVDSPKAHGVRLQP